MENTETIYKVGDKVWSPAYGWGDVVEIDMGYVYPIRVYFKTIEYYRYTADGRQDEGCPISLFFTEQQYIVERPKWQPKQGEWCWFWDDNFEESAHFARFGGMREDMFMTDYSTTWNHCAPFVGELPPHLKE